MRPLLLLTLLALAAGCAEPAPDADGAPPTPATRSPAPPATPGEPCIETALLLAHDALLAGGSALIRATATNCGAETLRLGETPCDAPHLWSVGIVANDSLWELPAIPWEHPAMRPRPSCEGERPVIELAPNATATVERRWNGMFLDCPPQPECNQTPAAPGTYAVITAVTGKAEAITMQIVVLPPESNQNRTLVLHSREWSWVNRTSGQGSLLADYGPHCAPARLTESPPALTIQQERNATLPEALLLRDLRAGGRPENVSSWGEGTRVDAIGNGTLALASAYDADRILLNVSHRDGEALVDGAPLAANETREFRAEHVVARGGATFEVTEVVRLTNRGPVPVLTHEPGPCF